MKYKKSPTRVWVKKLDDLIREILKLKYPEECVTCGRQIEWFHPINNPYGLQVSHYISRRYKALRWDLRNVVPMCSSCNYNHNLDPAPYSKYIIKTYGQGILDELEQIKQDSKARPKTIPIGDLEELYDHLHKEI